MKMRPFGKTDLRVSNLCLGTMHFGTRDDESTSYAMLDQYVEGGGNFLDTANMYAMWQGNGGESETLIGKWVKDRGNRDDLVIASKVGFAYQDVPKSSKPEIIEAECEKSLKRMGLDVIDIYYAHRDDRDTPLEAQLEAFDKLVRAGKVRYIGASNFRAWRLAEAAGISNAHGWAAFCCVQQRYTYLRPRVDADFVFQTSCNDDLLDYCREKQFQLLAYSPQLGGAYTRSDRPFPPQYDHADTQSRLAVLNEVAEEAHATPGQVVLAWLIAHDVVPLIGASTADQMAENLAASTLTLSPEQMSRLDEAGASHDTDAPDLLASSVVGK